VTFPFEGGVLRGHLNVVTTRKICDLTENRILALRSVASPFTE